MMGVEFGDENSSTHRAEGVPLGRVYDSGKPVNAQQVQDLQQCKEQLYIILFIDTTGPAASFLLKDLQRPV